MDLAIRPAAIDDLDELNAIAAEIDALHIAAMPQVFRAFEGPALERDYVAALIEDADAALLVAEGGGALNAAAIAEIASAPDQPLLVPRRWLKVEALVVRASAHRRGAGRALMAAAERWAAARGVAEAELKVWEFNAGAIAFYERLGYTTLNRTMWRKIDDANP